MCEKKEEENVNLATEMLRHIKTQSKRWFVAFMVCLILLFVSNMIWLYVFQQYDFASYQLETNDGGNANFIGNDGDINNGKSSSEDENKKIREGEGSSSQKETDN